MKKSIISKNLICKSIKKIVAVALVASIGASVVACSKSDKSSKSSLDAIKSKGVWVVGTAPGYPPFEFVKSSSGKGEVVGADIDLAKKIADELGVKLEVKAMEFDSILGALKGNKIDIALTSMTPTEERKKLLDFSDVYYEGENLILVSSKYDKSIKSPEDLKGIKVGLQKGSTQELYVKEELKSAKTKSLTAIPDLIADLKNGNIDAIVANAEVAKINAKSDKSIKLIEGLDLKSSKGNDTAALAIKKGNNEAFLKEVNKVIKDLKESGQYKNILDKNVDLAVKNKLNN